ncbi:hypothetical protein [Paenibacillus arenosi]|uniref:Uncharacterized protein n=1 Tax=Paenibacillus arenosi TaxID=2774142 RepID=A0ABR9B0F6_9BACL|nr:hypothetical protein [Paenibacillus arenosi]MBD8499418.1 hypothetical protein [Paenibacillus arenosi]
MRKLEVLKMESTWRVFIAIELPISLKKADSPRVLWRDVEGEKELLLRAAEVVGRHLALEGYE